VSPNEEVSERSWFEYRKYIINELTRIDKGVASLHDKMEQAMNVRDEAMAKMRIDIAMLQTKASMWGAVSGMVASAFLLALFEAIIHVHT
jgi:hypothetical protein